MNAGKTYDPGFLAKIDAPGLQADIKRAIDWYRIAASTHGNREAQERSCIDPGGDAFEASSPLAAQYPLSSRAGRNYLANRRAPTRRSSAALATTGRAI